MKKVSVISVNYNQTAYTLAFLNSVFTAKTNYLLELIIIDNGSKENPETALKSQFSEIIFIRSEKNLGFAGGNNLGLAVATGDFLFLVNNDTEFTDYLIDDLIKPFGDDLTVGMTAPLILYYEPRNRIQYAGFTPINYYTARNACIGKGETNTNQFGEKPYQTAYAHGAGMMLSREALTKTGHMPENYFLYYEEMDWCEQVKRAGFNIMVNPKAVLYHKESVSTGEKSALKTYFMFRNRLLFIRRNANFVQRSIFWLYYLIVLTPREILSALSDKKTGNVKAILKAIFWNLTTNKNSLSLGIKIQNN